MLRVMIDADVLFAGSASPSEHAASLVVLRLSELTLIDGVVSEQAAVEAERNLAAKMPTAVPVFGRLVAAAVRVVPDPTPDEVLVLAGRAHAKDLPILAAAVREACSVLVTFNVRDYQPGHPAVEVVPPGVLVQRVRHEVASLARRGRSVPDDPATSET